MKKAQCIPCFLSEMLTGCLRSRPLQDFESPNLKGERDVELFHEGMFFQKRCLFESNGYCGYSKGIASSSVLEAITLLNTWGKTFVTGIQAGKRILIFIKVCQNHGKQKVPNKKERKTQIRKTSSCKNIRGNKARAPSPLAAAGPACWSCTGPRLLQCQTHGLPGLLHGSVL